MLITEMKYCKMRSIYHGAMITSEMYDDEGWSTSATRTG